MSRELSMLAKPPMSLAIRDAKLPPTWCQLHDEEIKKTNISKMDRCRTPRFPAHSALRFSWPEGFLPEVLF
jgi:hypothetical protein